MTIFPARAVAHVGQTRYPTDDLLNRHCRVDISICDELYRQDDPDNGLYLVCPVRYVLHSSFCMVRTQSAYVALVEQTTTPSGTKTTLNGCGITFTVFIAHRSTVRSAVVAYISASFPRPSPPCAALQVERPTPRTVGVLPYKSGALRGCCLTRVLPHKGGVSHEELDISPKT